jgi:hypothetical protein
MPRKTRRFVWIEGVEVEITNPKKISKRHRQWCKERGVKIAGTGPTRRHSTWPQVSDSVGVNPIQRKSAMKHASDIGIPTEFNRKGQAVFTGKQHRKAYCEETKFFDRNGGYSDPQKHNRDPHPDA